MGGALLGLLILVILVAAIARRSAPRPRRPRRVLAGTGTGAGAIGAVYDLLNQDRRRAIEIIVEEKAAARDAEDAEGNLPDLEDAHRRET